MQCVCVYDFLHLCSIKDAQKFNIFFCELILVLRCLNGKSSTHGQIKSYQIFSQSSSYNNG